MQKYKVVEMNNGDIKPVIKCCPVCGETDIKEAVTDYAVECSCSVCGFDFDVPMVLKHIWEPLIMPEEVFKVNSGKPCEVKL